jgi:hypothetical protein
MNPGTIIIILVLFLSFNYIKDNLNNKIIALYKNPILKIILLLGLYYYGYYNIYITLMVALYYIYLGQLIQEKELLYKIN